MSLLYQPEFDECKRKLVMALMDSGIPKILLCNYARLIAEEIACHIVDEIAAEERKGQTE